MRVRTGWKVIFAIMLSGCDSSGGPDSSVPFDGGDGGADVQDASSDACICTVATASVDVGKLGPVCFPEKSSDDGCKENEVCTDFSLLELANPELQQNPKTVRG